MMLTTSKWMAIPVLAAAAFLFTADTPTANAQYGCYRGGGIGISIGGAYRPSYGRSYYPTYRSNYAPRYRSGFYHDTSHYDYHPTEIRRHGNHFDVIPGHYDYHRTGHWHH